MRTISGQKFAEIDAVLARSSKILSGADLAARRENTLLRDRPDLIAISIGIKKNDGRMAGLIAKVRDLPAVLRACGTRHHELYDNIAGRGRFQEGLALCYQEAVARSARSAENFGISRAESSSPLCLVRRLLSQR
ncbi:hypothetical protein NKH86_31590 [Mesorhizobium sp. M0913]